jgi:hypothetical protein
MSRAFLILLVTGCASNLAPVNRFIKIDDSYAGKPVEESTMVIEQKELDETPPFRTVGVLEVEGNAHDSINRFLQRVAEVGARQGCEVLAQRDLYELADIVMMQGRPTQVSGRGAPPHVYIPTTMRHGHDVAVWQFLCGVRPSGPREAAQSWRYAVSVAAELRDRELGLHVCQAYMQAGSHISQVHGCAVPLDVKKKN